MNLKNIRNLSILKLSTLSQCWLTMKRNCSNHAFLFGMVWRLRKMPAIFSMQAFWYCGLSECQTMKNSPSHKLLKFLVDSGVSFFLSVCLLTLPGLELSFDFYPSLETHCFCTTIRSISFSRPLSRAAYWAELAN